MGLIEQIRVAAMGKGEDAYTVSPTRVLDVAVIGGEAFIGIYDNDDVGKVVGDRCSRCESLRGLWRSR